jgi:hypothetical protein
MAWIWQYFPTYRMARETLKRFLKRKFGDYDFYIGVSNARPQNEMLTAHSNKIVERKRRLVEVLGSTSTYRGKPLSLYVLRMLIYL